jgi:hypothetical protein
LHNVCHPDEASTASKFCHPDRASNASGRKDLGQLRAVPVILTTGALATGGTDLGQLRAREAGSGFALLHSEKNPETYGPTSAVERCAISETGTGGARAPLSEILPAARDARFVRMTQEARDARVVRTTDAARDARILRMTAESRDARFSPEDKNEGLRAARKVNAAESSSSAPGPAHPT